jgi:hypothetical protein
VSRRTKYSRKYAPGEMKVEDIDATTLGYMETVAGKVGQAAVDAWFQFVGCDEISGRFQSPMDDRYQTAYRKARILKTAHPEGFVRRTHFAKGHG